MPCNMSVPCLASRLIDHAHAGDEYDVVVNVQVPALESQRERASESECVRERDRVGAIRR